MNAHEYRKTLTPLQSKAFYKLLEGNLTNAGYYRRNSDEWNKVDSLQRGAVTAMKEEFNTLRNEYYEAKAEIERQIKELQAKSSQMFEDFREAEGDLYEKAHATVRDKVDEARKARGNHSAEREVIEALTIAEYQKRLDKKMKKEVA